MENIKNPENQKKEVQLELSESNLSEEEILEILKESPFYENLSEEEIKELIKKIKDKK